MENLYLLLRVLFLAVLLMESKELKLVLVDIRIINKFASCVIYWKLSRYELSIFYVKVHLWRRFHWCLCLSLSLRVLDHLLP